MCWRPKQLFRQGGSQRRQFEAKLWYWSFGTSRPLALSVLCCAFRAGVHISYFMLCPPVNIHCLPSCSFLIVAHSCTSPYYMPPCRHGGRVCVISYFQPSFLPRFGPLPAHRWAPFDSGPGAVGKLQNASVSENQHSAVSPKTSAHGCWSIAACYSLPPQAFQQQRGWTNFDAQSIPPKGMSTRPLELQRGTFALSPGRLSREVRLRRSLVFITVSFVPASTFRSLCTKLSVYIRSSLTHVWQSQLRGIPPGRLSEEAARATLRGGNLRQHLVIGHHLAGGRPPFQRARPETPTHGHWGIAHRLQVAAYGRLNNSWMEQFHSPSDPWNRIMHFRTFAKAALKGGVFEKKAWYFVKSRSPPKPSVYMHSTYKVRTPISGHPRSMGQ